MTTAPLDRSAPLNRSGLLFGASAYVVWGLFPLLMHALIPAGALEITAQRAVWSLVVCFAIVAIVRGWARLRTVLTNGRMLATLAVAAVFIAANWLVYVFAVVTDQVNSASLGYYINPLVTVALGVVVLGERLRRLQVVAVGIAIVAVAVIGIEMGGIPWISLALAFSFGFYGLIKKRVGGHVDAITGLTVETMVLAPFAVACTHLDPQHRAADVRRTRCAGTGPASRLAARLHRHRYRGRAVAVRGRRRAAPAQRHRAAAVHRAHDDVHARGLVLRRGDAGGPLGWLRARVGGTRRHHRRWLAVALPRGTLPL